MSFSKSLLLIASCLCLFLVSNSVQAAAGDLDPTYGIGGKVTTDFFGQHDSIGDAAVTPDGKIVVVCEGVAADLLRHSCLVRYKVNGSLDPTFGSNGKVTLPLGLHVSSILVQPDGRIVAGGVKDASDGGDFALVRLNRDGSFDTTFDVDGVATADFFTHNRDLIRDVALQPDGKVVAVGGTDNQLLLAVARFNPDGSLDGAFGNGGRVAPGLAPGTEIGLGVALQPDGKIVAVGQVGNGAPTQNDFVLARFQPDGRLDNTFGNGGKVFTDFGNGFDDAVDVVIQKDGKILSAGGATNPQGFALARHNPDGSPDNTFGSGGKVVTTFLGRGDGASAVALQFDGKAVAAGGATVAGGDGITTTRRAFALARYNLDGSLDANFGNAGKVITEIGEDSSAATIVLQPDGKLVAAGTSGFVDGQGR